jgi:hypothetical protein
VDKNNSYYKGVFYEDLESFFEAVKRYSLSNLTPHSLRELMYEIEENLKMNIFIIAHQNKSDLLVFEMREILEETFGFIMK